MSASSGDSSNSSESVVADATATLLPPAAQRHLDELPDYAALLTARHEAHRATFRAMIADLPLAAGDAVLDVAIGDGFYTGLLSQRLDELGGGQVAGLDADADFLELSRDVFVDASKVELLLGDAAALPMETDSLDLVWCAHSLRSLDDAPAVLKEWARVVRPGGHIGILENDRLHSVLLPWPPEVELALYHAECAASDGDCDRPLGGLHAGRRLHRLATFCGLEPVAKRTYAIDAAPPGDADRELLKVHLADLLDRCGEHLSGDDRERVAPWVMPTGENYLPALPDLEATFIDHVAVLRVPAE